MTAFLALTIAALCIAQVPPEAGRGAGEAGNTDAPGDASFGVQTARDVSAPGALGGFVTPAVLPTGGLAVYGYVGAPEVGVGFRQGVAGVELEARARLNYFLLAFGAEAILRFEVYERDLFRLAPLIGAGLVGNTGTTGLDDTNFAAISIRILPGLVGTYAATETVTAVAQLELPFDLGMTPAGTNRFAALTGGGVEIALDETVSAGLMAQIGAERIKAPTRTDFWRIGWQVKLGFAFRLF